MPNYLVEFPALQRGFLVEDAYNEADAINVAFERAGLNSKPGEPERFLRVLVHELPLGSKTVEKNVSA
ncbi:MAG: hypothetical protein WBE13_04880 [Candidatus Acidiferrum sp.]